MTQFVKTQKRSAGKRAPTTIDLDPATPLGVGGRFDFIDENTIRLKLDDGTTVALFISQGYSYTEVKPVEDALSAKLGPSAAEDQQSIPGVGEPVTTDHDYEGDGCDGPASTDDYGYSADADAEEKAEAGPLDGPLVP